jgi:hypothetical protein
MKAILLIVCLLLGGCSQAAKKEFLATMNQLTIAKREVPKVVESIKTGQKAVNEIPNLIKSIDPVIRSSVESKINEANVSFDAGIKASEDLRLAIDEAIVSSGNDAKVIEGHVATIVKQKEALQNDTLKRNIEKGSYVALFAGIVLIIAGFVLITRLGPIAGWLRDIGFVLFGAGLFGAMLAYYFVEIRLLLLGITLCVVVIALILVSIKVFHYKRAGYSIVGSVEKLFNEGFLQKTPDVLATLKKSQNKAAAKLVDRFQGK